MQHMYVTRRQGDRESACGGVSTDLGCLGLRAGHAAQAWFVCVCVYVNALIIPGYCTGGLPEETYTTPVESFLAGRYLRTAFMSVRQVP
jgi:hypothetical protein